MAHNPSQINFNNTQVAFQHMSNARLKQGYLLFKAISSKTISTVGAALTNLAFKLRLPINGIIRNTIYKQFVGGESIADCDTTINELHRYHVGSILDYSVEGEATEEVYENTTRELLNSIKRAIGDPAIPFTVFKITGIGSFQVLEKITAGQSLNQAEEQAWENLQRRCLQICTYASQNNVPVLIDAEETWIHPPIDKLAADMMRRFNTQRAVIFNTYQMYRIDKLADLKADCVIARETGYILGVKLVRGAYMEKERERAAQLNYPSPIQPDKDSTDRDYNAALEFCIKNYPHIALIAGTHNEASTRLLATLMYQHNIPADDKGLWFSQLLGMSDNLSFNMAHEGYNVVKYVPYGPVRAVMPYLFRRAAENTSVAGQTSRELQLFTAEMKRRKQL